MDETRVGIPLTLEAQALMLLDHPESQERRRRVDLFQSPESFVAGSFSAPKVLEPEPTSPVKGFSLSMAARLSSDRYEERAKADALYQALKTLQQRNRSFSSGKVIRAR